MKALTIDTDTRVPAKFNSYPQHIQPKMEYLRNLIFEVADDVPEILILEETLKWGEPSYIAKKGSTLRMDWKAKSPNQYAMYFKCTSKLIITIKEVFGDLFKYEKNRAILFAIEDEVPVKELKACIKMALTYHSVKNMPLLGYEKE